MIQELPRYDDVKTYYGESLLEYIVKEAEKEWPYHWLSDSDSRSSIPLTFCERYNAGKIKMTDIICKRFQEAEELKFTINACGLDASKLFYLCLFLKDFVEGQTIDAAKKNPTHREELEMMVNELTKLSPLPKEGPRLRIRRLGPATISNIPKLHVNIIDTSESGQLIYKIGNGKKISINDGQTLVLIRDAIWTFLRDSRKGNSPYLDSKPLRPSKTSALPQIYRIALFFQYMKRFLEDYESSRSKIIVTDKIMFISRLIYVFCLSNDIRYYNKTITKTNSKKSFLKSNLSHYKNVDIPVDNKYYPR